MPDRPRVAALIVAAGRGLRAGGDVPKQYRNIGGRPVIARTLQRFLDDPRIDVVAVVIGAGDAELFRSAAPVHPKLLAPVEGGGERQESVRKGLAALVSFKPDIVLIHDAVRPFVTASLIGAVLDGLETEEAVLPAMAVTDTLKRATADLRVETTVPRQGLYSAQTPQGFRFDAIVKAHQRAAGSTEPFTDDASVAEWAGLSVVLVPGDAANVKLTTAEDLALADRTLQLATGETRTATGYDVHASGPGTSVVLGGVTIAHDHGLIGHSDADVALHALTDAVLGVIADGDIGSHFPPSDPQWRGVSSDRFLSYAVGRLRDRGGVVAHLDLVIIAESPRIGPHRDAMRMRIASIAGIDAGRVSVKATTNEGLGFLGRREGIAAFATATVRLPWTAA